MCRGDNKASKKKKVLTGYDWSLYLLLDWQFLPKDGGGEEGNDKR